MHSYSLSQSVIDLGCAQNGRWSQVFGHAIRQIGAGNDFGAVMAVAVHAKAKKCCQQHYSLARPDLNNDKSCLCDQGGDDRTLPLI